MRSRGSSNRQASAAVRQETVAALLSTTTSSSSASLASAASSETRASSSPSATVTSSSTTKSESATASSSSANASSSKPANAQEDADSAVLQSLKDALSAAGINVQGLNLTLHDTTETYPGGSYENRYISVDTPNGSAGLMTDLVAINPNIAVQDIKRMLSSNG